MKSTAVVFIITFAIIGLDIEASTTQFTNAKPAVAVSQSTKPDATLAAAQKLFERYVALYAAFDPAAADLYADDARIRNKRTMANGDVMELPMEAMRFKQLVRDAMPVAKARGDRSTFSNVRYAREGEGVRIVARRFSILKKYESNVSLLVDRGRDGLWRIAEEVTESRP